MVKVRGGGGEGRGLEWGGMGRRRGGFNRGVAVFKRTKVDHRHNTVDSFCTVNSTGWERGWTTMLKRMEEERDDLPFFGLYT